MATSHRTNDTSSGHGDPLQTQYWINPTQLAFCPDRQWLETKDGLLWMSCSYDEFYQLCGRIPRGLEHACKYYRCLDYRLAIACLPTDMRHLSAAEVDLLRPVPFECRLKLVGRRLKVGIDCQVGDCVLAVDPVYRNLREPTKYAVRHKEKLRERDRNSKFDGTYFGLVSTEPVKHSAAKDVSCFTDTNSPEVVQYARRESGESNHQAVLCTVEWIVCLVDKKFSLKAGDHVLLFDDRPIPEKGVVVRVLNDKLALVEFDFNGKRQTEEAQIEALMLAADYEVENAKAASASTSSAATASPSASAADAAAAGQHRRQPSDYDNAAASGKSDGQLEQPPEVDPIALAAERGLELNAAVLVTDGSGPPLQGFLRWCGRLRDRTIACVDCELTPLDSLSPTAVRRACPDAPVDSGVAFVLLERVRLDPRFRETQPAPDLTASVRFGHPACEIVHGDVPPVPEEHWQLLVGPSRGLQGHHNSCYLDATLFAMFTAVSVFDGVLLRKRRKQDIPGYQEIQNCLKLNIVNCLRKHQFVRADHVINLRELLDKLGRVPGMRSEEKDPEEFINLLLDHALKHDPYIKLSSDQGCHVLQLFVDASQYSLPLPDTETLLHLTLLQAGLKLKGTPPCLILQTPRSGKDYKLFDRVMPALELNISNLLTDHPHQCAVCGKLAEVECSACFMEFAQGKDYAFCRTCFEAYYKHKNDKSKKSHRPTEINYPKELVDRYKGQTVSCQVKLNLFAVICIHTSHYVCFLRLRQPDGKPAKWLFFDSMADRNGMDFGYNIPEVTDAGDIDDWLKPERLKDPKENWPQHVRRLLSDCYLCLYQSDDAQMYR